MIKAIKERIKMCEINIKENEQKIKQLQEKANESYKNSLSFANLSLFQINKLIEEHSDLSHYIGYTIGLKRELETLQGLLVTVELLEKKEELQ